MDDETIAFEEVQPFRQIWIHIIVLTITLMTWYGAIQQLIFKEPFGNNPASDSLMFVLWLAIGIGFPLFFYSMKLITQVRSNGLYVKFFPFHLSFKRFAFDKLRSYQAIEYRPLRDYGGWGIRYGLRGKAYNVSGTRGVMIEFTDGNRLMIGSQRSEEMAMAIREGVRRQR